MKPDFNNLRSEQVTDSQLKKATRIAQGKFTVILREEEEGGYSVQRVELPGAISQGETRAEALQNIKEAIQGFLEAFPEEADRLQLRKEVVEVTI